MSKKLNLSQYFLIFGIIVSIIISIIVYLKPQSQLITNSLFIGLIGIIISLVFELRMKFDELIKSISDCIPELYMDREILDKSSIDPYFSDKYEELKEELKDLVNGQYELKSIQKVYQDDIRSMKILKKGECLLSTCPMATDSTEVILKQIKNPHYKATINEHINCSRRGVESIRIYLFKNRELFEVAKIKQHLSQLNQNPGLDIRVIFRNEVELSPEIDFLIFADNKVSIGVIDLDTGLCNGAKILTDTNVVMKYKEKYNILLGVSSKITDLL
ncbi:MAG: hypothetical protein ABIJ59_12245 [Pseudomonadota bacterium]